MIQFLRSQSTKLGYLIFFWQISFVESCFYEKDTIIVQHSCSF